MNWLDGLITAIVIISALIGVVRGLTREMLSIISWSIAIWLAIRFSPALAPVLEKYISIPELRLIISFAAIVIALLLIGAVINYFISKVVHKTIFSGTDRVLGIFFGALRGVLVSSVFLLLATQTALPNNTAWKESRLLPKLDPVGVWLLSYIPENMLATDEET